MVGIVSLCALLIAYLVFRYPLFHLHGMKQFPLYLLIVGMAVIAVFGIVRGGRIAPVFTAVGYVVGFLVGCLLGSTSYDPGGGTLNNMWQIWLGSYAAAVTAGVMIEIFSGKK